MRRKQITYAHKRSRNRTRVSQESNSSPLEDISDPEQYLTRPEMARRILKRSRSGSASTSLNMSQDHIQVAGYKRPRMFLEENQEKSLMLPLIDNYNLQTPYPTQLTEGQVYRLESSRGLPLSPDHEFSPVPLVPLHRSFSPAPRKPTRITPNARTRGNDDLAHRTSSRSLKENMTGRNSRSSPKSAPKSATSTTGTSSRRMTRSKSKARGSRLPLASPYTSRPSSPHIHPLQDSSAQPIAKINTTASTNPKRTLSDTYYNPNLPQPQSTANSPTHRPREAEDVKARRPSAPSATSYRPDVASWFVSPSHQDVTIKSGSGSDVMRSPTIFDLGSRCGARRESCVDFNRPPSQLSFSSAYDENIFGDVQGVSTPFGLKPQRCDYPDALDSSSEGEDEDQFLNNHAYLSRLYPYAKAQQINLDKATSAFEGYLEHEHSTWVTDSLISPPTTFRAYNWSRSLDHDKGEGSDMQMRDGDDETSLGLGPSLGKEMLLRYEGAKSIVQTESVKDKTETLNELFEGLEVVYGDSRPMLTRSRSLDLDSVLLPPRSPSSHSGKGAIHVESLQSPVCISPDKAKHTDVNSDTSVRVNTRGTRDRRGTIRASDFPPAVTEARRTRSGTVVGPTRNRRERSGTVIASARPNCLSAIPQVIGDIDGDNPDTSGTEVDMQSQRVIHDTDEQMPDCEGTSLNIGIGGGRAEDGVEADTMNIVGPWRDEDWGWAVADPPSPVHPRRTRAKKALVSALGLRLMKGRELWQMREHDEDDGDHDALNLLG